MLVKQIVNNKFHPSYFGGLWFHKKAILFINILGKLVCEFTEPIDSEGTEECKCILM